MGSIPVGDSEFFFVPCCVIVEKDHLHYLLPSLKFTIFITCIYYTLDDFDIADPGSMQDACHISTVNGLAHHMSLVAQLIGVPNRYSGRPWVRFPSGTQNFSLSHARVIVEKDHLHYLLPSLKFTIFIIYYTLDDFDIADPSSMQDVCHIST